MRASPMQPDLLNIQHRRRFLKESACGLGTLALAHLLADEGRTADAHEVENPLQPKAPHFTPRAMNVIFIFMAGAPSQLDLFDPKPEMQKLHGQPVPESFLRNLQDPVIKASASVMASPRTFTKYGNSGMDFSDYVPHLGSCADDWCMVRSLHTHTSN